MTATVPARPYHDVDISSAAFWRLPFEQRDSSFAQLRREAPVSWHPPMEVPGLPPEVHGEPGFWALVRAREIAFASENHELFSSDSHRYWGVSFRPRDPKPAPTFLEMDPPEHKRYRRIMSGAFTPRAVRRLSEKIEQRAEEIVERVIGAGEIDFVREVASKLPMLTVADMLGVPGSLAEEFAEAGDKAMGANDPAIAGDADPQQFFQDQLVILREIGLELIRERRANPRDDLATALALADFDGRHLTDDEIESVMLLLSVAGNDTTKQTTSHTVVQLWRNPDQKAWLTEDFEGRIDRSIEEFVRHASPVIEFARTATQDVEIAGQVIPAGDKVVLFYASANRDDAEYEDPDRFDLTRPPHPHAGFGGGGVHYCLGNHLGRAQLKALFRQLLTKLPNMEVGEPEPLVSEFIHGIRRLPVRIP
ncbi:cytochrome P450 [Saccharopolyspora shandongensis]|uniref:cytochrome P450 n=1 Tax=Saccharopolyspora shandongensis TaxID=418495 RepID=UPI00340874D5